MDEAEKIAMGWEGDPANAIALAADIRSYGEQCRRAGAEAMREAAAKVLENGSFLHDKSPSAIWAKQVAALIRALPLPSAGEAALPAAGWRDISTAPNDGTYVILFDPDAPDDVLEGGYREDMQDWLSRGGTKLSPTQWMPLPSPPPSPPTTERDARGDAT